jgi:hypothetical protein
MRLANLKLTSYLDHSVGPIIWRFLVIAYYNHVGALAQGDNCRGPSLHGRLPGRDHQFCVIGTFCRAAPLATGPVGSSLASNTRRIMPTLCRCRAPNCR